MPIENNWYYKEITRTATRSLPRLWRTKNGDIIQVGAMSDEWIKNCIGLLESKFILKKFINGTEVQVRLRPDAVPVLQQLTQHIIAKAWIEMFNLELRGRELQRISDNQFSVSEFDPFAEY